MKQENESKYISCTFGDFVQYVEESADGSSTNVLSGACWAYADYKHMIEVFDAVPEVCIYTSSSGSSSSK